MTRVYVCARVCFFLLFGARDLGVQRFFFVSFSKTLFGAE